MTLVLVTPPASEPVLLADAKKQCHIDTTITADDTLITSYIVAARTYVENETGLGLLNQQWQYTADRFPHCNGVIKLGRSPLVSVQSITYVDTNGATQTLATNQYVADTGAKLGVIAPAFGVFWPPTPLMQHNAVTVNFTVGYADVAHVPGTLYQAMLLLIGEYNINREASVDGMRANINPQIRALIDPHVLPVV